jgi:hypothetical protein
MTGDADLPTVPEDRLDGWTRTEAFTETVFQLSKVSVEGHTAVYEDDDLRGAVRAATDGTLDRMWRFFFATRLEFSPPLPTGVGPRAVFSKVAGEASEQFVATMRDRGFDDVSEGHQERMRVDTGDRARLRRYSARLALDDAPADGPRTLPTAGLLAVWHVDGEFRLAGGAYPARSLAAVLDLDTDDERLTASPEHLRDDLLSLLRAVR